MCNENRDFIWLVNSANTGSALCAYHIYIYIYIYIYIHCNPRRIRCVGNTASMGEESLKGKQKHGRPRRRWEDSIMDLKRIWMGGRALESSGSGQRNITDSGGHVNECSGFKTREIS